MKYILITSEPFMKFKMLFFEKHLTAARWNHKKLRTYNPSKLYLFNTEIYLISSEATL